MSHGSHYTLHLKRNKTTSRNKEEEQKLCHAVLLHLMSKVKNIASLQLYGEEQASLISSKQLHHRTQFITMPVRIRSQIRKLCPFRV
ncbi:hypothetical protein YC2023_118263 [Brassica napus]